MLRNILGPLILFFLQGEREKTKKTKTTKKLDHFLTLKRARIGPLFNFTAFTYIYIYMLES